MILGPDLIYQCPNCNTLYSQRSLVSGNNIGQKLYSDGKQIAPMFPQQARLIKCHKCGSFLWLDKMGIIGEHHYVSSYQLVNSFFGITSVGSKDRTEQQIAWNNATSVKHLEIAEYFEALEKKVFENVEEERYIRIQLWRTYNDRFRDNKNIFQHSTDELKWTNNLKSLIKLLDTGDRNHKIMQAEIYRNLGDFTESLRKIKTLKKAKIHSGLKKYLL